MANSGSGRANQRGVAHAGAGGDDGAVSLSHPRLSFRQWGRVHQPYCGQVAEQASGGTDQIAAETLQRQRAGGVQERSGGETPYGIRAHRRRARRSKQPVLSGALQSLLEFSPSLWSAGSSNQRQGQAEKSVSVVMRRHGR